MSATKYLAISAQAGPAPDNKCEMAVGRGRDEHGPIMVDRTGVKVTLQEKYSRNSTGIYGLVAEQVANLDENMGLISKAAKTLPTGTQDLGGPPTSLSPSGKDRLLFFLANFSRDTTHFVNGTQLGDRQTFQVAFFGGPVTPNLH